MKEFRNQFHHIIYGNVSRKTEGGGGGGGGGDRFRSLLPGLGFRNFKTPWLNRNFKCIFEVSWILILFLGIKNNIIYICIVNGKLVFLTLTSSGSI